MNIPNHQCQICGREYYACNKCEKLNSYKLVVDKPECYGIYLILLEIRQGVLTMAEANDKLRDKYDLSLTSLKKHKADYLPEIYNKLTEILRAK